MKNNIKKNINDNSSITRRELISLAGAVISGTALGSFLTSCYNEPVKERCIDGMTILRDYSPEVSSIWIPKGEHESHYSSFKQMIENATDFSWLHPGDKVLVKLALNSGYEYPMTTDPWLLRCMIKLLKEKGATNIFVGDQSGAEHVVWTENTRRGSSRQLSQEAGLYDVIVNEGATPCFFEEKIDEVGYSNAYVAQYPECSNHWGVPVYITSVLNEVDHIIYLPRIASHIIANNTSGMKIGIGFLRDDSRLDLHQGGENFYKMYEEINDIPLVKNKLRLIVSSGRKILRTDGPDTGNILEPDFGLVLASSDLLAHELLAYAWLEANNHIRSEVIPATPTFANNFLISFSFQDVDGFDDEALDVPEFIPEDIYCHPSVINFLNRKGGRPIGLLWTQLNENPDEGIVDKMIEMIKPA